jgi:hypothetical protein
MKWYDLLMGDENRLEHPLLTSEEDMFRVDAYDLKIGKQLQSWDMRSYLRSTSVEDDGEPDDILGEHLGVPTFSTRLQKALAHEGVGTKDVQYLPIRVMKSTGEEISGFAIANIIARVPALDYDKCFMLDQHKTRLDPLTGRPDVTGIGKIALKAEPLTGHDIIRLLEFFPPVLVSERFANVFRKGKFTGAIMTEVRIS